MKRIKTLAWVLSGCFAFSIIASAQPAASIATQQQESSQRNAAQEQMMTSLKAGTNAPEIYSGESSDVGPQHILRLVPRRTWFEVSADSEYLYTDNALLKEQPVSATEFVNSISAAFAPTPYRLGEGRLAPSVGFLSQWYNYGIGDHHYLHTNDFNAETVFIGAKYLMPNDVILFGEFDYNRFVSQGTYREFYHDFTPAVGMQRLVKLRNDLILVIGAKADYHKSWNNTAPFSNSEDRADGILTLTLDYQVVSKMVVQPYYQFQYTHYRFDTVHFGPHPHDRNDYLNSTGLSVAYYFTPNISLRGFGNYNMKHSTDTFAQAYHEYNVGADLTFAFHF